MRTDSPSLVAGAETGRQLGARVVGRCGREKAADDFLAVAQLPNLERTSRVSSWRLMLLKQLASPPGLGPDVD